MHTPSFSSDNFREEKPPFFHVGISRNISSGGLIFDADSKKELEVLIDKLTQELKEKEHSHTDSVKISELSDDIVEQQAQVLEQGGRWGWAKRLRERYSRRVDAKLKKEDKKRN